MIKTKLFKGVVYLSQEHYNKLIALGAIEVNGNVIEYDESILYVTPQTLPEDYYTKEQTKDLIKNQVVSGDEFIIVDEGEPGSAAEGKTVIELDRTNIETETATEDSEKLITSGAVFNALAESGSEKVLVELVSAEQLNGTLTQEQFNKLIINDQNYIETSLNGHNEKYYFSTEASVAGYRVYTHIEHENMITKIKIFTITESVLSWVITEQLISSAQEINIDNSSITKNNSEQLQTVGIIDQNTGNTNKEWTGTQAQYDALAEKDPNTLYYITDGKSLPAIEDLTLTIANSVISSAETFTHHVHVMLEFETDGVHGGTDFILHPFDTSICFVTYDILVNGQLYSSQAYLDEAGNIKINVPTGLTFANAKGHYIEYGG